LRFDGKTLARFPRLSSIFRDHPKNLKKMFCPKCRTEYREGFYICADCNIELVGEIPPEPEPEFVDFKEVMATYNPADIALIKSVSEAEDITYFFKGKHFLYMRPLADPARLMVRKDQAGFVIDILKDMDLAFMGINLPKNDKKNK